MHIKRSVVSRVAMLAFGVFFNHLCAEDGKEQFACSIHLSSTKILAGTPLLVSLELVNHSKDPVEIYPPEPRYSRAFLFARLPGAVEFTTVDTEPSATAYLTPHRLASGQTYITYVMLLVSPSGGLLFETPGTYTLRGIMLPRLDQEISSHDADIMVVARNPEEMKKISQSAQVLSEFSTHDTLPVRILDQYKTVFGNVPGFAEFLLLAEALAGSNVYNARPPGAVMQAIETLSGNASPVWRELAWLLLAKYHDERFHLAEARQALEKFGNARSRIADHVRETLTHVSPGQVAPERERVLKPLLKTLSLPRNQLEDKDAAELWRLAESLAQWEATESADRLIALCDLRAVCPRPGLQTGTTPHLQYPFASALVAMWNDGVQDAVLAQLVCTATTISQQKVLVWCLQRALGPVQVKALLGRAADDVHSQGERARIRDVLTLTGQGDLLLTSPGE